AAFKKAQHSGGLRGLNEVEDEAVKTLMTFLKDVQRDKWSKWIGESDSSLDEKYTSWLRDNAPWVPLRVLIEAAAKEVARAGSAATTLAAFRAAHPAAVDAEKSSPGKLPNARAGALLVAARDLGAAEGTYPSAASMQRESHFNRLAP